jgi:RHS repeat-associated protein
LGINIAQFRRKYTLQYWAFFGNNAYSADYTYDPNSNMVKLLRRGPAGNTSIMDNLNYEFETFGLLPTNRLKRLFDAGSESHDIALENNDWHNYKYDASGNLIEDVNAQISGIAYTADGKVEYVEKSPTGRIIFIYDARGDRVCKADLGVGYEYYLRDANGEILEILTVKAAEIDGGPPNDPWNNVRPIWVTHPPAMKGDGDDKNGKPGTFPKLMSGCLPLQPWTCWLGAYTFPLDSIDEYNNPFLNQSFQTAGSPGYLDAMKNEWYIYGSSGHGRFARAFPVGNDGGYDNLFYPSPTIQSRYLKHKQYELKDHLGNVRVVVSDLKNSKTIGTSNPPYKAEVLAAYNYYPFGMLQPGMYAENNDKRYRFGFNGMLRDDDMTDKLSTGPDEGRGNSYSTQFRQYDPRVTRWFSNDPLKMKFPWTSPYTGMGNNPVSMVDPFGNYYWVANHNEKIVAMGRSNKTSIEHVASDKVLKTDRELNNIAKQWADPNGPHYAPKIASYVLDKNNKIPVVLGNLTESSTADGQTLTTGESAINNPIFINQDSKHFELTLFHETLHNKGYGEFGAYSAQFAAGFDSEQFKKQITFDEHNDHRTHFLHPKDYPKDIQLRMEVRNFLIKAIREDGGEGVQPFFDKTGILLFLSKT